MVKRQNSKSDYNKIRNAWGLVYDVDSEMPPFYLTDEKGTFWRSGKGKLYKKNNAIFFDHIMNHKLFKIKMEKIKGLKDISLTIEPTEKGDIYVNGFLLTEKEEIKNKQCSITSKRFMFWLKFEAFIDVKEFPQLLSIGPNYRFINLLGQGKFAFVYKGFSIKEERLCAIKTARYLDRAPDFFIEKAVLTYVCHTNIVKCLGFIQAETRQFLITEFVSGGSLEYRIKSEGVFTEAFAKHIFSQLFSALSYLHHRNILHRDLKPQNIVLTESYDDTCVPKVVDLGSACYVNVIDPQMVVGSNRYMAPEILKRKMKNSLAFYTEKVDVWGIGVCLFIALNHRPPILFDEDLNKYILRMNRGTANFDRLESYRDLSQATRFILQRSLNVSAENRASISDLMEDGWTLTNKSEKL